MKPLRSIIEDKAADEYSDIHAKRAKWHYKNAGKLPGASLAKAGVSDFKSRVAKNFPGTKNEETLQEVSKKLLSRYHASAVQSYGDIRGDRQQAAREFDFPKSDKLAKKSSKRYVGLNRAVSKIGANNMTRVPATEEIEMLDELSKELLTRYVRKAAVDTGRREQKVFGSGKKIDTKDLRKYYTRKSGVTNASYKLAKEGKSYRADDDNQDSTAKQDKYRKEARKKKKLRDIVKDEE
jgi:hypothetical protein